jgi:hypothetical protein
MNPFIQKLNLLLTPSVFDSMRMQAAVQALARFGEHPEHTGEPLGVGARGQVLNPGLGAFDERQQAATGGENNSSPRTPT